MSSRWLTISTLVALACTAGVVAASDRDDDAIVADLEAFFATEDVAERAAIARRIEADPAYDRARVSEWLHRAHPFEPTEPGSREVVIPIDHGGSREVLIRVPAGYDPSRPWPLIYALHGSGGTSRGIVDYVVGLLGDEADQFIIAAPQDYEQTAMGEEGPPSVEHPAVLLAIRKMLHVDSDRVYVTGYSRGGYTTWTLATLHADQFAAAIPCACTYSVLPYVDGLWETMLPNVRWLPVLHCYGAEDELPTLNLAGQDLDATITQQNDRLMALANRLELTNITFSRQPHTGHGGVVPPADKLRAILKRRRVHAPTSIDHHFRFIHQASAYWLEGLRWKGHAWSPGSLPFEAREGESFGETLSRVIHARLGHLTGEIDGQTIRIDQQHVADMVAWLMDGMIDWDQPVRVMRGHVTVFSGHIKPDLDVCLTQAARTYDLDRLRWAGLRMRSSGDAQVVTGETRFPPLLPDE